MKNLMTQILLLIYVLLKIGTHATEENKFDEEPSHNLIARTLENIYARAVAAEKNLKLLDECMVCYQRFPVTFQFFCGHELCSVCAESILHLCDRLQCPKCRAPLPKSVSEWLPMVNIYLNQLTPDIPIEKLKQAFALICSISNLISAPKCIYMGIDVNTKGFCGYFPLHFASQKNVVEYLLHWGADVNQVSDKGVTPLAWNSHIGNLFVVKSLIRHGANINQADNDGETPLFMASLEGHLPVVQYLVKKGATINQGNHNGETPLFMASLQGHLPVLQCLIQKDADINQPSNGGETSLFVSSEEGHLLVVEYLIQNGADVNQANKDGYTPLYVASQNAHLPVVKYLIQKGAKVNQSSSDGWTPYFISIQEGHLQVVEYLIQNGADVNHVTKDGVTPLAYAIDHNQIQIAELLLEKGADIENTNLYMKNQGFWNLIDILDKLRK
jgi:ankyrin repeat protein